MVQDDVTWPSRARAAARSPDLTAVVLVAGLVLLPGIGSAQSPSSATVVASPARSATPIPMPVFSPAASGPVQPISVSNGTDRVVTLSLAGVPIARLGPRLAEDPIPLTSEPSLPWTFAAVDDAGFTLVAFTATAAGPFGSRNDLSCGRIDIWSITPILGPANGPGTPGDCGPPAASPMASRAASQ